MPVIVEAPFFFVRKRHIRHHARIREIRQGLEVREELERELHRTFPASAAAPSPEPAARQAAAADEMERRTLARAYDPETAKELQRELNRVLPPPMPPLPEALACGERLAMIAHYSPLPDRVGPGECGGVGLVQLDRVLMPDRTEVALIPPATLRCGMAETVAQFVREDIGPAAAELGAPLLSITELDSYQCRPRNNIKGAKISEHGKGDALDIKNIRLRNGGVFDLTDRLVSKPFREELRTAACDRFSTVLGPGSDAYHSEHIHFDLAERSHRYHICQWNILEPLAAGQTPLPERKPAALKGRNARAQVAGAPNTKAAPDHVRRCSRSKENSREINSRSVRRRAPCAD